MTLQNGLFHQGEAYMWSDTGFWTETGKRAGSGCKVFAGSQWPWAATFSGASPAADPYHLPRMFSGWPMPSPAALLENAGFFLRAESEAGRDCRLMFAFPCARQGAQLWHIAAEEMPGRAAFEPVLIGKFACWGAEEDWYAPYAGRDLTPREMREVTALQLQGNAAAMFELEVEDPVSDIIETRVSRAGIEHRQLRLIAGELSEVPVGDGLGVSARNWGVPLAAAA